MKRCFKCGQVKCLSEFYKHKQMADGHLNKCKECTKSDVHEYREKNIDRIRVYDRSRGNRQGYGYVAEYRLRYPNKYRAHSMINYAIRSGNIFPERCELCDRTDTHAHHDDYLKPLNVRWLCPIHHKEWHAENGEGLNG